MNNKKIEVKVGDVLSDTFYLKVTKVKDDEINTVSLENGDPIVITGRKIYEKFSSADYYTETQKVSKLKLVDIFMESRKPFTVEFEKLNGELRTLRGVRLETENGLGRSHVIDFDIPKEKHNLRQVDHRTIHSLILDGIKYILKK